MTAEHHPEGLWPVSDLRSYVQTFDAALPVAFC